jgi:hypothetical protein
LFGLSLGQASQHLHQLGGHWVYLCWQLLRANSVVGQPTRF